MQEKTGAAGQGVYWNCREKNNTVTDRIDTKQALHPEDAAEWERTIQVAFLKMEQNISVPLVLGFWQIRQIPAMRYTVSVNS